MRVLLKAMMIAAGSVVLVCRLGQRKGTGCYEDRRLDRRAATEHGRRVTRREPSIAAGSGQIVRRSEAPSIGDGWKRNEVVGAVAAVSTFAAAIFAGVALVAAFDSVRETRKQVDAAQKALIATDRPWLKVDHLNTIRLDVTPSDVLLQIEIGIGNIGRSPAQKSIVFMDLIPNGDFADELRSVESLCQRSAEIENWPFEQVVFPNDVWSRSDSAVVGMEAIRQNIARKAQESFESARLFVGEDVAERRRRKMLSQPFAAFTLIGCVTYVIPASETIGQTAFAYDVLHACGLGLGCAFDMSKPVRYDAEQVIVRKSVGATFAR